MKRKIPNNSICLAGWFSLFAVFLIGGVLFSDVCRAASEQPPVGEVVLRLQSLYEKTKDFQANFIQETTVQSIRKTDVEEGVVYFKNPRQMLWDYTRPKSKKLIVNAEDAWLYLPEEKIVYTQKAQALFQSAALVRFLSGLGRLSDDFTIEYATPARDADGHYLLKLIPREAGAAYQFLQISLNPKNLHIVQVSFDDVLGNTTVLKFSQIRFNLQLSPGLFVFEPPPDVSIFQMP